MKKTATDIDTRNIRLSRQQHVKIEIVYSFLILTAEVHPANLVDPGTSRTKGKRTHPPPPTPAAKDNL